MMNRQYLARPILIVVVILAFAASARASTLAATPSELTVNEAAVSGEPLVISLDAGSTLVATIAASGDLRVSLSDSFATSMSETTASLSSTLSVTVFVFAAADADAIDDLNETVSVSVTDIAVTNSPLIIDVNIIDSDPEPVFTVSGRIASASNTNVGLSGVSIALTGDSIQTTTSGIDGSFSFDVNPGQYAITPFSAGHLFDPSTTDVSVVDADVSGIVFLSSVSENEDDDDNGWCASTDKRGRFGGRWSFAGFALLLVVVVRHRGM